MNSREYKAALDELGLNIASQRTANLLGINIRQSQRYAAGHANVPEPLARLLEMYIKYGTDEKFRTVRCGQKKIEAVLVDATGVWDVNFPWGIERLQGLYPSKRALEQAVRVRFKRRKEQERKAAAA